MRTNLPGKVLAPVALGLALAMPLPARAGLPVVDWLWVEGSAWDIGVGVNGQAWIIGTDARPGGFGIYRRSAGKWSNVPGGAVRVDVDPLGNAWVVNDANNLFQFDGAGWRQVPGTATDIGIGANHQVWAIGTTPQPGGFNIVRYTPSYCRRTRTGVQCFPEAWEPIPGGALRVDVAPDGRAVVVSDNGGIYQWNGSSWDDLTANLVGGASDVSVAADGTIWALGRAPGAVDFPIFQRSGGIWTAVPGLARAVSAGDDVGRPWVTNSAGNVFRGRYGATRIGLQLFTGGVCGGWSYYTKDPVSEVPQVRVVYGLGSPLYTVEYNYLGCRYGTDIDVDLDDWYEVSGCKVRVTSSGLLEVGARGANTSQYYGSDAVMINTCQGTTRSNNCPPNQSCRSI